MTTFDTPDTPRGFIEAMLRSSLDADRLVEENINDRWRREAHTHTAVNGHVAAMALEMLRQNAPQIADELAEHLHDSLVAGDLAGPTYRAALALSFDPDQWIAEFNERAASRGAKPEAGRRAAHVALTDLAVRWEQMADHSDAAIGQFEGPAAATLNAEVGERGRTYRKAATDIRDVLRTGQVPHDLMTSAELEQHGTSEEPTS